MIIPSGSETIEEYHASGCWGSTRLNDFLQHGPLIAYQRLIGELPMDETPALVIGNALHSRFDGSYDERYAKGPQVSSRRTKAWQEAEREESRCLLLPSEVALVDRMEASIRGNLYADCLLQEAEHEVGFRRRGPDDLFGLQCRADLYLPAMGVIVDIKTTADIDGFEKSVVAFGYFRQAALYRWLVREETGQDCGFSFLVVEKSAPHRSRMIDLDTAFLQRGHDEVMFAIDQIADCYRKDDWRDPGFAMLAAPAWMRSKVEVAA